MDADFFNRRLKRFKNREGQQISVILERPDILFVLNSSYKLTGLLPMTTAIGYGAQLLMVGTITTISLFVLGGSNNWLM